MHFAFVNTSLPLPGDEVLSGWLSPRHCISRDQVGSTWTRLCLFAHAPDNNKKKRGMNVALGNDLLGMRRDRFARWEVWQWHGCTAGTAINSAPITHFGTSNLPDTSKWMVSYRCFQERCVESSTWPLVFPVSFTVLCVQTCRLACFWLISGLLSVFARCLLLLVGCSTVRVVRRPQLSP